MTFAVMFLLMQIESAATLAKVGDRETALHEAEHLAGKGLRGAFGLLRGDISSFTARRFSVIGSPGAQHALRKPTVILRNVRRTLTPFSDRSRPLRPDNWVT
jgi:hypothetical protein